MNNTPTMTIDQPAPAPVVALTKTLRLEPEQTEALTQASGWVATAQALTVINEDTKTDALRHRRGIKALIKTIEADYKPITLALDLAKKEALGRKNAHLRGPEEADAIIKAKVETYDNAVAAESARVSKALADKLQREQDEAAALAATVAAAPTTEDDELLATAFVDQATGELPSPVAAAPPPVSSTEAALAVHSATQRTRANAARDEGSYYVTTRTLKVVNLRALVEAIATGRVKIEGVTADESWLRAQTKGMDPEDVKVLFPGVEIEIGRDLRQRT